jgi:hypothetical protein
VISELHCQQRILLYAKTRSIPDRIVYFVQRYARPIVRGKARAAVEFGAKISLFVRHGFSSLHSISWDPYNEVEDLIPQAKKYKLEYGVYPERICADRIYIIPGIATSVLGTIYDSLVSDWGGRWRIQRSLLFRSSSSAQTSRGATKCRESLGQKNESMHVN